MKPLPKKLVVLIAPYVVGMIILVMVPALATAVIAFTRYTTLAPPTFVGWQNFRDLVANRYATYALFNSLFFVLLAVPLRLLAAFFLALLLQPKSALSGVYRTAVYIPTIIPEAAYALIWLWVFNPVFGPLNFLLATLGLPTPDWLNNPILARLAFVFLSTFQIGEGFILLLVGLQSIPNELYEAADIDGAHPTQRFWHITLPLLAPWLLILLFRDLLASLQSTFTPSYIITYGGPYYATTFIPLVVYELAFDFFEFGMAAALLLLTYVGIGGAIWGILRLSGLTQGNYHV